MEGISEQLPHYGAREINCPQCRTAIPYYDIANASWFGCPDCHHYFMLDADGYKKVLRRFADGAAYAPDLQIGATGTLDGHSYVVAGFMRKAEEEDGKLVKWNEYRLYNKAEGYRTLVDFNGHWMLVRPIKGWPQVQGTTANYFDEGGTVHYFQHYHSYYFTISYAAGSFDENVLDLELIYTKEYINPPEMLISEFVDKRTCWYLGRHISQEDVARAFGVPRNALPGSVGVVVVQPSPYSRNGGAVKAFVVLMGILIVLFTAGRSLVRPSGTVLEQSFPLIPDSAAQGSSRMIVTAPFTLKSKGSVDIKLSANLNNEWLETSVTLINDGNGSTYDFSKSIEYYYGRDGGESWTEGSQDEQAFIGKLPAGTYHLNIFPYSEKQLNTDLSVKVIQHPMLWSNLVVLLLVLVSLPFVNMYLNNRFEQKRMGTDE